MSKKKRYSIVFYLSENTWSMSGIPCPDCVDESNYQAWSRYLSKQIDKLLCAETMQTAEFQEELEKVRRDKEERIAHQKRLDEAAEVRRRRSCMARPNAENGGYPPTQNGDIRSLFWLFSLMALQN